MSSKWSTSQEIKVGILAALLASLCCAGPFVATLIGLSGLATLFMNPTWHPLFLGAGLLGILGYVFWQWRRTATCAAASCEADPRPRALKSGIVLLVLFLTGYVVFTRVIVPRLSEARATLRVGAPASFPPGSRLVSLRIAGMTCAGCAGAIQGILGTLPGVVRAEVSHSSHGGTICYLSGTITTTAVLQAVEKLGYRATVASDVICAAR